MALVAMVFFWFGSSVNAESFDPTAYEEAMKAYDGAQFRRAYDLFSDLAELGHGGAEFMLGVMYFYGQGVTRDYAIASIWFYKSARQGNPAAQLAFGSMFIRGVGVARDNAEAYKWLTLASMGGIDEIASQARTLRDQAAENMSREEIAAAETAADEFEPVRTGPLGLE